MPARYDLRDLGQVTPVKNQGKGGNCWAFAALGALESAILKASGDYLDLSEFKGLKITEWNFDVNPAQVNKIKIFPQFETLYL